MASPSPLNSSSLKTITGNTSSILIMLTTNSFTTTPTPLTSSMTTSPLVAAPTEVPPEIHYNFNIDVIIYSIIFVFSAFGNLIVFNALRRTNNRNKLKINLLIYHLSIAELIVTFIMIPTEIAWRVTVMWVAGDLMCRVMMTLRIFGPYLTSMILVCISVDRYYAIIHPLKSNFKERTKRMLAAAWVISLVCSLPQFAIYHVEQHPLYPHFTQCVTFNTFTSEWQEKLYSLFSVMPLYVVPLIIIIICYSSISLEIYRRSKSGTHHDPSSDSMVLRRANSRANDCVQRARYRTLKMTITIILAFICCWTPYVFMVFIYLIAPDWASTMDKHLQNKLFMFAVSNSVINPLVYGSYTMNIKRSLRKRIKQRNNNINNKRLVSK